MLSSCSKIDMKQFENNTPKLDLFSFFEGKTVAYGIFEDRFGNLKRQFRVNIFYMMMVNKQIVFGK